MNSVKIENVSVVQYMIASRLNKWKILTFQTDLYFTQLWSFSGSEIFLAVKTLREGKNGQLESFVDTYIKHACIAENYPWMCH